MEEGSIGRGGRLPEQGPEAQEGVKKGQVRKTDFLWVKTFQQGCKG